MFEERVWKIAAEFYHGNLLSSTSVVPKPPGEVTGTLKGVHAAAHYFCQQMAEVHTM